MTSGGSPQADRPHGGPPVPPGILRKAAMVSTFHASGDLLADRRYAYAAASLAEGDFAAAADLAEQTLELAPRFAPAWALLGRARMKLGEVEAAAGALRQALEIEPDDILGVRLDLVRLGHELPGGAMTAGYVRALFDQYADRFDTHLVEGLGYCGPAVIMAALGRVAPDRRFARALDLGCGTGLMGEALRPRVEELLGCDLSPAMVEKARVRGVYDELAVADLVAFLADEPEASADLAVAADVLVYIGDLAPVLRASARALRTGGLFAFTVQAHEGEGWVLGEDARYAHGESALREGAAGAGFTVAHLAGVSTRRDRGRDVPGIVVVLTR